VLTGDSQPILVPAGTTGVGRSLAAPEVDQARVGMLRAPVTPAP
jgi:hypothetical protein